MADFIVAPGEIVKEYLSARGLTQKEVSKRIGVSERHLSQLLNGRTRFTEDMALKFEKIMPDVPAIFWLNYEVKYQEWLAREREEAHLEELDLKEIAKRFHFGEVFKGMGLSLKEQAIQMLQLLGVSEFERARYAIAGNIEFMQDGGEEEAVIVWLKLCEEEIENQNSDLSDTPYSKDDLEFSMQRLKMIALNPDVGGSINSARKLLNRCGVYLVVRSPISNAKVRGALVTHLDHPAIYISQRFKTHDHVWFAIVHELEHLLLHYDPKRPVVSMGEFASEDCKDDEANLATRAFFVNEDEYLAFVELGDFGRKSICHFARSQQVDPGIIVGFLQHDGLINFSSYSDLKSYC